MNEPRRVAVLASLALAIAAAQTQAGERLSRAVFTWRSQANKTAVERVDLPSAELAPSGLETPATETLADALAADPALLRSSLDLRSGQTDRGSLSLPPGSIPDPLSIELTAEPEANDPRSFPSGVRGGLRDDPERALGRLFDRRGESAPAAEPPRAPAEPSGARPHGIREFASHLIRNEADLRRAFAVYDRDPVPSLLKAAKRMAPYYLVAYRPSKRSRDVFFAVDLRGRPDLAGVLPNMYDHEGRLLRKILARAPDVQVLLREPGKTPDTIVNGVVTELKSLLDEGKQVIGDPRLVVNLGFLLRKANQQVREHAERHGLGAGAVAIDLTQRRNDPTLHVPVDEVNEVLNEWSAKTEHNFVDRVFVFAGEDFQAFVRKRDGTYELHPDPVSLLNPR